VNLTVLEPPPLAPRPHGVNLVTNREADHAATLA
jgi:hypothetical protein